MRQRRGVSHSTEEFILIEGPNGIMQCIENPLKPLARRIEMKKMKVAKTRYWIIFFCRELARKAGNDQNGFINIGKISTFKKEIMANVSTKVKQESKNWFNYQIHFLKSVRLIRQEEDRTYSVDMNTPLTIGITRKPKTTKRVGSKIPRSKVLKQIAERQKLLEQRIKKAKAANNLIATLRQLPADTYLYAEFMELVKQVEKHEKEEKGIIHTEKSNIQCLKSLLD